MLVTIGKGILRRVRLVDIVTTLWNIKEMRTYLSHSKPSDTPDNRQEHLRALCEAVLPRLGMDLHRRCDPACHRLPRHQSRRRVGRRAHGLREVSRPGNAVAELGLWSLG